MVLIVGAAAGLMRSPRRALIIATALGGLVLSLPDTARMIRSNIAGRPAPDAKVFAQTPELWQAVRRYAPPTARVANNPLFLQDLTPWPANMSWALLANRSSCFAGRELALAFAPLPAARREAINMQFIRVFDGEGTPGDVGDMARKYACDVVIVMRRTGPGTMTRSRQVPIIAWPRVGQAGGGFMCWSHRAAVILQVIRTISTRRPGRILERRFAIHIHGCVIDSGSSLRSAPE